MPTQQAGFYDYDVAEEDFKRRQAVANAMQQASMEPLQQTPGAPTHWSSVLAKLVQGYGALKDQEKLKEDKTAFAAQSQKDLVGGLQQFFDTSQGHQKDLYGPTPDGGVLPPAQVPGDPKKAIFEALAARHPQVRQLAMQQLTGMGKQQLSPKDLLAVSTPESVMANPNDPSKWQPKRELKGVTPGEVLLDASGRIAQPGEVPQGRPMPQAPQTPQTPGGYAYTGGQPLPGSGARPPMVPPLGGAAGMPPQSTPEPSAMRGTGWETVTIGGDLYQKTATGLRKLDNAPKVNIATNINSGENAFMKGIGEDSAKLVTNARNAKVQAQQDIVTADRLEGLFKQGVVTGPTANIAIAASALADTLKLPGVREKLGASEEFKAIVGRQAAAALSGPGGAKMTDKDMELFLSQYPQLTNSSQGIPAVIKAVRDNAQQKINYADSMEKSLQETYPEAARLLGVTPSAMPYPAQAPAGTGNARRRTFNPSTGKIE